MASELIIRIGAKSEEFKAELEKIKGQTRSLEAGLAKAAKVSGIAFAGLTASIGVAVNEAGKFEKINTQFEVLTGNIETANKLVGELQDFSAKTPFQFEEIAKAGQQLLAFGIETDEVKNRLREIGDVAAATGAEFKDVSLIFGQVQAAGKLTGERLLQFQERAIPIGPAIAKTMGVAEESVKELVSKGLVDLDVFNKAFASLSKEGGLAFGGMEKASQTLQGQISTLKDNFSLLLNEIGKEFLPLIKSGTTALTGFFQSLRENPRLAKLAATILGVSVGLTGLVTALALGATAFLKIRAAILVAQIALGGLSISIKGLVGATGIGLLLILATEIYLNWEKIWPAVAGFFSKAIDKIIENARAAKDVIGGLLTLDSEQINRGLETFRKNAVAGVQGAAKAAQEEAKKPENQVQLSLADLKKADDTESTSVAEKEKAKTEAVDEETQRRIELARLEAEAVKDINDESLQKELELLKKRNELFKAEQDAKLIKNDELRAAELEKIKAQNEALLAEQRTFTEQRREQEAQIREEDKELELELQELDKEERALLRDQEIEELRGKVQTEREIEREIAREKAEARIKERNQFLKDEKKFGKEFATINQTFRNENLQGAFAASQELTKLQQSESETLKGIGRAASLVRIQQETASGAIAAYSSLAGIPIVGPALGAAAAAALIAFGAEQTAKVLAANEGGLVPRNLGIAGRDSVSATLTPGELITPDKNFDEVVEATARARGFVKEGEGSATTSEDQVRRIEITAENVIDNQVFMDNLIEGIREKVLFENADLGIGS